MKKLFILFLFILFFVTGCASQKLTLISPTGSPLPTPRYTLNSQNISSSFYYSVEYETGIDLDKSIVYKDLFLSLSQFHKFHKFSKVVLTIEILNFNKVPYYVMETIRYDNKREYSKTIAASNRDYRMFIIDLPTNMEGDIEHLVTIVNSNNMIIIRIGEFKYRIKERK